MKNLAALVLALVVTFASFASAQSARIEVPAGSADPCLEAFNRAYASGNAISDAEAAEITRVCVDMDVTQAEFFEGIADALNGSAGRPRFRNITDVMGHFRTCRETTLVVCPGPDEEPETPPPAPRHRLILECRGACVDDAARGIEDGIARNPRRVVCEPGTVPLSVSYRRATVDGEARERRHRERGITLDIVYCFDPASPTAPRVIERDVERTDLSGILERLDRLENACGPDGMRGRSDDWDALCSRFDAVLVHTTRINELSSELGTLRDDLDALRAREDARWAADCGKTDAEWSAMSESEQLELIRSGECDGASSTTVLQSDWHLRFHLGAGLHLVGTSVPATLIAPYAVVYTQFEALPSEHFGFYLRGMIGAGDLLDRRGQWNSEGTIGASGIFGGSAGATFRLDEMIAFDLGVASSAVFNPGGQIGRSVHSWPLFTLGGEFRVRVHPFAGMQIRWFHVEAAIGLDYTHSEVRRTNADAFTGVDGLGGHGAIGVGFSF